VEAQVLKHKTGISSSFVQHGAALTPMPGESESGDRHLVQTTPHGALIAVVDGLGHGSEAASAARAAIETVVDHSGQNILELFQLCHRTLGGTRGAAMILAFIDNPAHTLTWLSIGNVDGALLRGPASRDASDESVLMRGGVVGLKLPILQAVVTPIYPGDTLVFATDGIQSNFVRAVRRTDTPQQIADAVCANCSKRNDDALVLVARYMGS
jgi:phosphoserine phosphatase RsbX